MVRVGVKVSSLKFDGLFLGITTPIASLHVNDSRKSTGQTLMGFDSFLQISLVVETLSF